MANTNPKTLVVQKFGGTSLASPERIKHVASLVTEEKRSGKDVIVVVSAMGDTTDSLIKLAEMVTRHPPKRELDMLMTAGERISMALLSMAISDLGYQAISFTGSQSGIVTDTSHTRAKILDVRAFRVRDELEKGRIVIVAGFQGVSPAKEVTTLGRGGSDTTCVALAAAFRAAQCEIYTDVGGVYTADPRIVPWAGKIDAIPYDEMLELSYCGAEVLHWRSVDVASRFKVRVHVRSSLRKELGTIVTDKEEIEIADVRAITQDLELAGIRIEVAENAPAMAERVLEILEASDVSARLLSISPGPEGGGIVSIVFHREQQDVVSKCLSGVIPQGFQIDQDVATVSVVGQGLWSKPGIARRVLCSLRELGVEPEVVSTSGMTLTIAIRRQQVASTIRKLHGDLGLDKAIRSEEH